MIQSQTRLLRPLFDTMTRYLNHLSKTCWDCDFAFEKKVFHTKTADTDPELHRTTSARQLLGDSILKH